MANQNLKAVIKSLQLPPGTQIDESQLNALDAELILLSHEEVGEVVGEIVRDTDRLTILEMIFGKLHQQDHPLRDFIINRKLTLSPVDEPGE